MEVVEFIELETRTQDAKAFASRSADAIRPLYATEIEALQAVIANVREAA
jgi:hypothetical protein